MARFGVYLFWKIGMAPVDICVYVAFTSDAAFDYAETLPFVSNRKRGWFVKVMGIKKGSRKWGTDNRQYARHSSKEYNQAPPETEAPPIELPAPAPPTSTQRELFAIETVWKYPTKETKRRL